MSKPGDLAERPDLHLGEVLISPARRRIEGPGGVTQVEPRTMQVFLMLLDAAGKVVTRNDLFDQVWGGAMVGDDSLNRAVGKVRRIAADTAPSFFEVETIPRTGYRLTGPILASLDGNVPTPEMAEVPAEAGGWSRRTVVGAGIGGAALLGGGAWWARNRQDPEFEELLRRGRASLAYGDGSEDAVEYFRLAAAIRPDDPRVLGLYAYALAFRGENVPSDAFTLQGAEEATQAALAADPSEPHARLAQIVMQRSLMDFAATEDRLRGVLRSHPDNNPAMQQLWNMLQCVGRSRDALALVERALQVEPLGATNHFPRAQLLWITGRTAEADRVIERALEYWPEHRFVRFARFMILGFTGRERAALAMLDKRETVPQHFSQEAIALWRINLTALEQRTAATIARAREASLEAAKQRLALASQAVMTLSVLGDVDSAFEVANALFAVPKTAAVRAERQPVASTAWRFAPWLFIPPTAALRADPRFELICDHAGLTDYWRRRGVQPDYRVEDA